MSSPANLDRMFKKGVIREIYLKATGQFDSPDSGKHWLILSGHIHHITGTLSMLWVQPDKGTQGYNQKSVSFISMVDDTQSTGEIPLFQTLADVRHAQWQPVIVTGDENLRLAGGSGVYARIKVLEW